MTLPAAPPPSPALRGTGVRGGIPQDRRRRRPPPALAPLLAGVIAGLMTSAGATSHAALHGASEPMDARADQPWLPALIPVAHAARTDAAPVIDGVLDDACWAQATPIESFIQVEPLPGVAPTERTTVRVLWDERALYIAIRCHDRHPAQILARQMRRDSNVSADDHVTIILDPVLTRRSGYLLRVGAAGGRYDALVEDGARLRAEWDGTWIARTTIDDGGWTAEFEIPAAGIAFGRQDGAWGLNIERVIRRRNETVRWAGATRNRKIESPADAGLLEGIGALDPGHGLTVKPSMVGTMDLDADSLRGAPSLDVFQRLSPTTTLAITLNTDFAEVEVDDRMVNLTRFPLFFPEKREFFLQDAGVFSFGGLRRSPIPFFSRRIGIGPDGRPRDILAGMKLTGRERSLSFGTLVVQMDEPRDRGQRTLAVGRALLNILDESTLGIIATHGNPADPSDRSLVGGDLNLRFGGLNGDRTLEANLWVQGTHSGADLANRDPVAFGGRIAWPNEPWSFSAYAARIGRDFRPALGFTERIGRHEYNANLRRRWRPDGPIRTIDASIGGSAWTDLSNRMESGSATLPEFDVTMETGDSIGTSVLLQREVLAGPFNLVGRIPIGAGTYDWTRLALRGGTSTNRVLAARAGASVGGFYDGERRDATIAADWRPAAGVLLAAEYQVNDLDLPSGDFIVRIGRLRFDAMLSPDISWSTLVQWDNVSELLGLSSRLRWEVRPGSDLWLVINHAMARDDDTWTTGQSEVTTKVGWSFRF